MSNSIVFVSSIISTLVVFVPAQVFESQPSLSFAIQPPPVLQNIPKNNFFDQASSAAVVNRQFAHRAVVLNAENEAKLPPHLTNPFYKNPRVADALAKSSWIIPGETVVTEREAEKIPRQKIYLALKNAGLVARRRR
ncbi:hypothetical protein M8J77_000786 [Diaphorina citri]|nr:hypothetical protein M8J77_000786 [Diaphorina citri]